MLALPAVAEAVVVAAPDPRFGEQVAAVLRIKADGAMPTMQEVREHFELAGMARQKWPKRSTKWKTIRALRAEKCRSTLCDSVFDEHHRDAASVTTGWSTTRGIEGASPCRPSHG